MTTPSPARSALREVGHLLRLGGPLMVAQLAQMSMGFVDTVMVGRVGATPLAAVAVGTSLWTPMFLFVTGVMLAVSTGIAHHYGAGRHAAIGGLTRQALWLSLGFGLLAFTLLRHAGPLMAWLAVAPAIVPVAQAFLDALSWGAPAAFLYLGVRFVCEGTGHTLPVMLTGFVGLGINVLGNYALVYGHFGLPALGAAGSGYVTAASFWVMAACLATHIARQPRYRGYGVFARWDWPRRAELGPVLKLGLPIGLTIFAETSLFAAVALRLGVLGPVVVAGHQIALNIAAMAFMVPLSLSMAIAVRVGHAMGGGDPLRARLIGRSGIALCGGVMLVSASALYACAEAVVGIYTRDAAVAGVAVALLGYAALFQFSDGLQVSAAAALRGVKDTRVPMLITMLSYWGIAFPVGYWLAFGVGRAQAGLWTGLVVGLSCAAVLLNLRFHAVGRRLVGADGGAAAETQP